MEKKLTKEEFMMLYTYQKQNAEVESHKKVTNPDKEYRAYSGYKKNNYNIFASSYKNDKRSSRRELLN